MTEIEPIRRKLVGIFGAAPNSEYARLLDVLSQLYPVEFCSANVEHLPRLDGLIVLNGDVATGLAAAARGTEAYVVVEGREHPVDVLRGDVRLGTSLSLEEVLRSQVVCEDDVGAICPLTPLAGDVVLGFKGNYPFWLERSAGPAQCQLVAIAPPVLQKDEFLIDYFRGSRFLRLLPLMNFLRQMARDVDWQSPLRQACIVLDDPSLHWPTYGFVNFRLLAEHAIKHNYCVGVATIPLDTFWVSKRVANVFRSHSQRLSLLIHGNNHSSSEMLHPGTVASGLESAAQALRRMDRVERKHKLSICRVMEPPHGTIDASMFRHLLSLGYDGALVAPELLLKHNRGEAWEPTIGLEISAMTPGGFPLIPRIRAYPFWKNDVLLAAFLRQPIVVTVHHQDAAQEMSALAEIALTVNRLGAVVWSDMAKLAQGNYMQKVAGDVLLVRMCSRVVKITVPAGVRQISVLRPWVEAGKTQNIVIGSCQGIVYEGPAGALTRPGAVDESTVVEVTSEQVNPLDFLSVGRPKIHLWPLARKFIMEIRDRSTPALALVGLGRRSTRMPPR